MAESAAGHPVIATVQHKKTILAPSIKKRIVNSNGNVLLKAMGGGRESESTAYGIFLYSLVDWKIMCPGMC
jgi:hypothetical protein